ncbi:uncharacterized protein PSFLO_01705 [Pseudozyma flocculosa]|uniref:Transmembrane protein n=1 Tax=Pseudozyma flocculosa TaxID=84751 RepID=A0A5C3EVE8_9BASI|nr:uncharacterized protein PSFLO_01705 [Pseudozyma flocculosa]
MGGSGTGSEALYPGSLPSNLDPIIEGGIEVQQHDRGRPAAAGEQSIINAAAEVESLLEDGPAEPGLCGRSGSSEDGTPPKPPNRFRRKELRLSQSLSSGRLHGTFSSSDQLRSVPSSATSMDKGSTDSTMVASGASGHGYGSGVYWNTSKAKKTDTRRGRTHRPRTSSTSGTSAISSPDSPEGSHDTSEGSPLDGPPAARSGSTFELVQWQVATESASHLEDIFLPLGGSGGPAQGEGGMPATPLKRPRSPEGLDIERDANAVGDGLRPIFAPDPNPPSRCPSGLGISAVDGGSGPSDLLRGMPGYAPSAPPETPRRESFDLEIHRSAALERVLQQLASDPDGGVLSPSAAATGTTSGSTGGAAPSLSRHADGTIASDRDQSRQPSNRSSIAWNDAARATVAPLVVRQRSSSLRRKSSTVRRASQQQQQQQEPRASMPSLDVFRREPLTGLMDHRQSMMAQQPDVERSAADAEAQLGCGEASLPFGDRLLTRCWVLLALLAATVVWQALFFVFPAPYLWDAIQPALVAVAAVLFSLVDVTLLLVLLSMLPRRRRRDAAEREKPRRRGDPLLVGVETIWIASTAVSLAYATALCAVQVANMARSQDRGAQAAGIHFDRNRSTAGGAHDAFRQVLSDVPITAVLFVSGCLAVVFVLASTVVAVCRRRSRLNSSNGGADVVAATATPAGTADPAAPYGQA